MAISNERLDQAFDLLVETALKNERCPQNHTYLIDSTTIGTLARLGKIRVDISGHNWRRVIILTGPHKGQATAPDPTGAHVWKVVGKDTRINGKVFVRRAKGYAQPSVPRDYSRDIIGGAS